MQPQTGNVEIAWLFRRVKPGENPFNLVHMLRIQTSAFAAVVEPFQSPVPEAEYHLRIVL